MKPKIKIIVAMLIWGSMGIFVRHIDLPAGEIALVRGVIGLIFLFGVSLLLKKPISIKKLAKNKWILITSGILLGVNWIFLFEAYKHTSIPIATVSYYLAPIIIAIVSPLIFKEKLTILKVICSLTALIGLACISGVFETSQQEMGNGLGILFGVAAAISYASLTILNKYIKGLSSMDTTFAQFGISSIILIPYTILNDNPLDHILDTNTVILLVILGVFHTGLAFWLFFSAIRDLKAQTIAVFSYLDPVTAILLSALLLNERLDLIKIFGACIILGSAFISEFFDKNRRIT